MSSSTLPGHVLSVAPPLRQHPASNISIQHARDLIRDLMRPQPIIYWTDFLFHLVVGYGAASLYFNSPLGSLQQVLFYLIAGFALFRVGSFIHEIVHFRGKEMLGFKIAWNVLAGIPMLMPSFFYRNHIDHHSQKHYGTGLDGEYLPIGSGMLRELAYFYSQVMVLPIAVFLRFFLITPLSFFHPGIRRWALERGSFFVINLQYRQPVPSRAPLKLWALMEFLCCLRAWAIPLAVVLGFVTWERIPLLYALAIMTLGLNYVRNVVAHRYASSGAPMSHMDQFADSVNLEGVPFFTELFFPLGLRYHALHHLFPTLPYHNLGKAHHRLMQELPQDSFYHQTVYPGFWKVALDVVRRAHLAKRLKLNGEMLGADVWYDERRKLIVPTTVERHQKP